MVSSSWCRTEECPNPGVSVVLYRDGPVPWWPGHTVDYPWPLAVISVIVITENYRGYPMTKDCVVVELEPGRQTCT